MPVAVNYAAWLAEARQLLSEQQHVVRFAFSADSTAVSFDKISYATAKVLPEQHAEQE